MRSSGTGTPLRCTAVWVAATAIAGALAAWSFAALGGLWHAIAARDLADQPFDADLVWLCAAFVLIATGWLWMITTAVTIEAISGHATQIVAIPAPMRRLVLRACGVAVAGGLAMSLCGPAGATPGRPHQDELQRPHAALAIAGLPMPDRATSALPGGARLSVGPIAADPPMVPMHEPGLEHATVVVRPGDSLWEIARRDLGPDADEDQVSARWREIYRLNRDLLGADPDLIQPAQRLRLPTGVPTPIPGGKPR